MGRISHQAATATKARLATAPTESVRLDADRRLYIIGTTSGFTCLGFDVAEARRKAVLEFMGVADYMDPASVGTLDGYEEYSEAMHQGSAFAARKSVRCHAELTPQLIGLETKRVEVVDSYGNKRRFTVGRSTGWFPCHVEIKTSRSSGGWPVTGAPFASVKVL